MKRFPLLVSVPHLTLLEALLGVLYGARCRSCAVRGRAVRENKTAAARLAQGHPSGPGRQRRDTGAEAAAREDVTLELNIEKQVRTFSYGILGVPFFTLHFFLMHWEFILG